MGNIGNVASGTGQALTGFAALGNGIAQSNAQASQAAYQKQQYEFNAKLADLNAADAITRGDKAAKNYGTQIKQVMGAQRAATAASGVQVGAGSAADVQSFTNEQGNQDLMTIKNNAWREAWGFKIAALNNRSQGAFAGQAGAAAADQTLLTGGLSFINSGFNSYLGYSGYQQRNRNY